MPIVGRDLNAAAKTLAGHLNSVLARTITSKPLIPYDNKQGSVFISFRDQGAPTFVTLNTRYGPMDLYIGLFCDAVEGDHPSEAVLRITEYAYALRPHSMAEPLFRWEFVRPPDSEDEGADADDVSDWCRHHVQGNLILSITDHKGMVHQIRLDDWHTPSDWVAIEEVIRFCIVDLGVKPRKGWNKVLKDSYKMFRTEFRIPGD